MRRRDVMGLIGAALGLSGCWGSDTFVWRQKLTVVVQTPQGEKTGSAVTQVKANVGKQGMLSSAIVGYKVKGEAAVVDLGNGKYLFALLSNGGNWLPTEYWAETTFLDLLPKNEPGKPYFGDGPAYLSAKYEQLLKLRGSRSVARDAYPLLVTFADINDPKSVKEVKPGNLADVFGAGYSLKSMTLEVTDEDVTDGVFSSFVPWSTQENPVFINWKNYPADHPLRQVNKVSFKMK